MASKKNTYKQFSLFSDGDHGCAKPPKSRMICKECGHLGVYTRKSCLCSRCYYRAYDKENGRGIKRAQALRRDEPARALFYQYRCKSKKLGLPFDLTVEWFKERLARGICEATGLLMQPLNAGDSPAKRARSPWVASVDRIDPQGGYTQNNARLVVWLYNAAKSNYTDQDVLRLAFAVIAHAAAKGHAKVLPLADSALQEPSTSGAEPAELRAAA
jgi:hypothetical protein